MSRPWSHRVLKWGEWSVLKTSRWVTSAVFHSILLHQYWKVSPLKTFTKSYLNGYFLTAWLMCHKNISDESLAFAITSPLHRIVQPVLFRTTSFFWWRVRWSFYLGLFLMHYFSCLNFVVCFIVLMQFWSQDIILICWLSRLVNLQFSCLVILQQCQIVLHSKKEMVHSFVPRWKTGNEKRLGNTAFFAPVSLSVEKLRAVQEDAWGYSSTLRISFQLSIVSVIHHLIDLDV